LCVTMVIGLAQAILQLASTMDLIFLCCFGGFLAMVRAGKEFDRISGFLDLDPAACAIARRLSSLILAPRRLILLQRCESCFGGINLDWHFRDARAHRSVFRRAPCTGLHPFHGIENEGTESSGTEPPRAPADSSSGVLRGETCCRCWQGRAHWRGASAGGLDDLEEKRIQLGARGLIPVQSHLNSVL